MRKHRAFTLVELLVVIGIIAILVALLLPTLSKARQASMSAKCLSNMRNMEIAHWMYIMSENRGFMIQVGLGHGGVHSNEDVAWINTLQRYYGTKLLVRCPADESPHWPGGIAVPGTTDVFRRTSYGVNGFTDPSIYPNVPPWDSHGPYFKINQIRRPSAVVHFLEMTETGQFAGADHPHVENWVSNIPAQASNNLQIDRHGGPKRNWQSIANYGFIDGHAETLRFGAVFKDFTENKFDPTVAR